jgi:hypothetical protein
MTESKLFRQFVGIAYVRPEVLDFPRNAKFEATHRNDSSNRIPVLVDLETLNKGLKNLENAADDLFNISSGYQKLKFEESEGYRLECLWHNETKLNVLGKRWCAVDLYLQSTAYPCFARSILTKIASDDKAATRLKNLLAKKYFVDKSTSHGGGDVYRRIRSLYLEGEHKRSCIERTQLTRREEEGLELLFGHKPLVSSLDGIIPISGLWYDFSLSRVHSIIHVAKLFPVVS